MKTTDLSQQKRKFEMLTRKLSTARDFIKGKATEVYQIARNNFYKAAIYLTATGLTVGVLSCDNGDVEEKDIATRTVVIPFSQDNSDPILEPFIEIRKNDADKTVKWIELDPQGSWEGTYMADLARALQKAFAQSKKVRAKDGATIDKVSNGVGLSGKPIMDKQDSLTLWNMGMKVIRQEKQIVDQYPHVGADL